MAVQITKNFFQRQNVDFISLRYVFHLFGKNAVQFLVRLFLCVGFNMNATSVLRV